MAVLLVTMSVAAVLMTAAMPVWKQMAQREKEEELIFRGRQYVRAIALFQRRAGPGTLPPSVDALVDGRFLRKKFKDPITNDDFDLLSPVQATASGAGGAGRAGAGQQPATGAPQGSVSAIATPSGSQAGGRGGVNGIMGVASKSKEASLRVYNGRTHYNEWQFIFIPQTQQAGGPGGAGGAGGRAGPAGRGQRGGPPPPFGGPQGGAGRQGSDQGGRGFGPAGGRGGAQPVSPFPSPQPPPFQPGRGR